MNSREKTKESQEFKKKRDRERKRHRKSAVDKEARCQAEWQNVPESTQYSVHQCQHHRQVMYTHHVHRQAQRKTDEKKQGRTEEKMAYVLEKYTESYG